MILKILEKINSEPTLFYIWTRAVIVYIYGIFLFRFGNARFNFQYPFDTLLVFLSGAIFGKAIFDGPLLNTLLISFFLILFHQVLSQLSIKYKKFQFIIRRRPKILVRDGKINWKEMKKNGVSKQDLLELCRRDGKCKDLSKIKKVILEGNGTISLMK